MARARSTSPSGSDVVLARIRADVLRRTTELLIAGLGAQEPGTTPAAL